MFFYTHTDSCYEKARDSVKSLLAAAAPADCVQGMPGAADPSSNTPPPHRSVTHTPLRTGFLVLTSSGPVSSLPRPRVCASRKFAAPSQHSGCICFLCFMSWAGVASGQPACRLTCLCLLPGRRQPVSWPVRRLELRHFIEPDSYGLFFLVCFLSQQTLKR